MVVIGVFALESVRPIVYSDARWSERQAGSRDMYRTYACGCATDCLDEITRGLSPEARDGLIAVLGRILSRIDGLNLACPVRRDARCDHSPFADILMLYMALNDQKHGLA